MGERVTLATSTGLPFLFLAIHVGTGLIAMVVGFLALATRKGGRWHRKSGLVFVYAMVATGIVAAGIAVYERKGTAFGGAFTAYLVFTAWTAVKPLPEGGRRVDLALMVFVFSLAILNYTLGFMALRPGGQIAGVPTGMIFFMSTIMLLAAIGDARMITAGGIHGTRRLARHLWRMCFGLFIATGSFFLGQMKFIPRPIRIVPVLYLLAISPLLVLLYWMWRVRLRHNLRGMVTLQPIDARRPAPMPGAR